MTHRFRQGSWSRVGAALLVTSALVTAAGCSKKKQEDGKAEAEKAKAEKNKRPEGDRFQDGTRLAAAMKDWTKRWADTADLPACDPLLKSAEELALCKTAADALVAMKAAAAKPEPEATQIHLAAELAYATEAASEKLRNASMERMQEQRTKAAAPGASGSAARKAPPIPLPSSAKAHAVGSAAKLAEKMKELEAAPVDPAMQVMQAYSRVNRASLRYLSQFLQFGPLPTRNAAFTELEGLAKRKEAWPALGRTLREAAMAENDPTLQGKLKTLAPKMSRRSQGGALPGGPGMAQPTLPPGHVPVPPVGEPPPEAAP